MDTSSLLPSLSLFTLAIPLVIMIGAFAYFLRKRRNRDAAKRALSIDDPQR